MNLLLYGPVIPGKDVPDFGEVFRLHIESKKHPQAAAASKCAWNLLARGLDRLGCAFLPRVEFTEGGKPYFVDSALHFSISHSGNLAAVLLSDFPCSVDIECIRDEVPPRLADRCLNDEERRLGCDFFEIWTKKECIAKLDGFGMPSRPSSMHALDPKYADRFACQRVSDADGNIYALTCLCRNPAKLQVVAVMD